MTQCWHSAKSLSALLSFYCLLLLSCHSDQQADENGFEDGVYCADVTYFNPGTETNHTYQLNVEIRDERLIKIRWPNGGWLDDSHFSPPSVTSRGYCSFKSDKGYDYTIQIKGDQCTGTSAEAIIEDNRPREFTLSIQQCAGTMQMSEEELRDYETLFNVSRYDRITESMCGRMFRYIQDKRELDTKKQALDNLIENGYIQGTLAVGDPDSYQCQVLIVKRRGHFYLLEAELKQKVTMGLITFDPDIRGWQETAIVQDPAVLEWRVYHMRVIDDNDDKSILDERMKAFCRGW